MAQFVAGEVLTAANLNNSINAPTLNNQTASAYSLVLTDAGKFVTLSASTGGVTVTVPAEASASFSNGTAVGVAWLGAASAVSIVAASGVTLNSTIGSGSPVKLSARYAGAQLYKTGTNTWIAIGSLA